MNTGFCFIYGWWLESAKSHPFPDAGSSGDPFPPPAKETEPNTATFIWGQIDLLLSSTGGANATVRVFPVKGLGTVESIRCSPIDGEHGPLVV